MLMAIYSVVSIWVFFKLMKVLLKATWGLTKSVVGLIFWLMVIGASMVGLIWVVLPILIIVGIVATVAAI